MEFEMLSIAHIAGVLAGIVIFISIIIYRKQLRQPELNLAVRVGLALLLLSCEASLQLSYVLEHRWSAGSLPFQLCSLMLLLSALLLLTKFRKMYSVVLFLGSMGALQALLTPNLDETFPHFRYFNFFLAHIGIIATGLFITAVERYRPTLRALLMALLWLHVLAIPAAITNVWTGTTNFMFLARKPDTASLLDMLAPWPWYLLQLEGVIVLICVLLLVIIKVTAYFLSDSE